MQLCKALLDPERASLIYALSQIQESLSRSQSLGVFVQSHHFGLNEAKFKAVECGWSIKKGPTMFAIINSYIKASQTGGIVLSLTACGKFDFIDAELIELMQ